MRNSPRIHKKRPLPFLFAGIISLVLLLALIVFVPPTFSLTILGFSLSILAVFLPLLIIALYSLPRYFLGSKKHSFLIALLGIIYSSMLLMELRHPFFLIVLLALFFTLELLFTSKRQ